MKLKDIVNNGKLYLATALSVFAMDQAIAANVHGTIKSIPKNIPVYADLYAINKNTGDTTKTHSNPSASGTFSMALTPGNYTIEADANHHYVWLDTAFVVNADTSLDLRLIKGQYDDGTPILISPHIQHRHSVLRFAKIQYERQDQLLRKDVMNWASKRRRLFVTGITGQSRVYLDSVLAVNETSPAEIYYDEKSTDSSGGIRIYGVATGHDSLAGNDGYTWTESIQLSTNPLIEIMTGAKIYIDTTSSPQTRTFSDELLHAEAQHHHSLWSFHILTQTGVPDSAFVTSPDEIYITAINQTLKLGDDWRKHKDTIKTIIEDTTITKLIVNYGTGWNMISVPTIEPSMLASAIFQEKTGAAFKYTGGYINADTLENGKGYWIKLPNAISKEFDGTPVELDTIPVGNRWNIVGGIGYPVSKDSIETIPPGILASSFFGYNGAYGVADTIQPGKGYWVFANQTGMLILRKPR